MPTAGELGTKLLRKVPDVSLSDADALQYINDALVMVAGAVKLPALETSDTVQTVTTQAFAVLPSDYQQGLYACNDVAAKLPVTILGNKKLLLAEYPAFPNNAGQVQHVCAVPPFLFYQPIPAAAAEMELFYYGLPPTKASGDQITEIPPHLAMVLVHGAAYLIYDDIEDGIEGPKVNTEAQQQEYFRLLNELDSWARKEGRSHRKPPIVGVKW